MRLAFIPLLLLIVPIVEIAAFIAIGGQIGIGFTLLMILVTAVVGTFLLRSQGISLLNRIQSEAREGRVPGKEIGEAAMVCVAGLLLLTPGFVTDAIGFLLFVPTVRSALWSAIASRITVVGPDGHPLSGRPFGSGVGGGFGGADNRQSKSDGPMIDLSEDDYERRDDDETDRPDAKSGDSPWHGDR